MSIPISAKNLHGKSQNFTIDRFPDECPVCHTRILPRFVEAIFEKTPGGALHLLQGAFQCTTEKCHQLFVATYSRISDTGGKLAQVAPVSPKSHPFSAEIQEVSPTFVDIYNQVIVAEAANLHQLTGIGLRKALEFLVKDYAISQKPKDADKIKAEWLGRCINEYIDDPKIKQCAKLAAWLGNDETHYIRKWEGKDINDLKVLIRLTVNWIENSLLTSKYTKEMEGDETNKTRKTEPGK